MLSSLNVFRKKFLQAAVKPSGQPHFALAVSTEQAVKYFLLAANCFAFQKHSCE
jgi:hypothetical protein